ncbi:hypothetical protein ADUPG1_008590, partial [Aduncisulcus paluster]
MIINVFNDFIALSEHTYEYESILIDLTKDLSLPDETWQKIFHQRRQLDHQRILFSKKIVDLEKHAACLQTELLGKSLGPGEESCFRSEYDPGRSIHDHDHVHDHVHETHVGDKIREEDEDESTSYYPRGCSFPPGGPSVHGTHKLIPTIRHDFHDDFKSGLLDEDSRHYSQCVRSCYGSSSSHDSIYGPKNNNNNNNLKVWDMTGFPNSIVFTTTAATATATATATEQPTQQLVSHSHTHPFISTQAQQYEYMKRSIPLEPTKANTAAAWAMIKTTHGFETAQALRSIFHDDTKDIAIIQEGKEEEEKLEEKLEEKQEEKQEEKLEEKQEEDNDIFQELYKGNEEDTAKTIQSCSSSPSSSSSSSSSCFSPLLITTDNNLFGLLGDGVAGVAGEEEREQKICFLQEQMGFNRKERCEYVQGLLFLMLNNFKSDRLKGEDESILIAQLQDLYIVYEQYLCDFPDIYIEEIDKILEEYFETQPHP